MSRAARSRRVCAHVFSGAAINVSTYSWPFPSFITYRSAFVLEIKMSVSIFEWLYNATRSPTLDWKLILVASSLFDFSFKTYLDFRQYRVQCKANPPAEAVDEKLVTDESFKRSQEYSRTKLVFGVFSRIVEQAVNLAVIKYDILPKVWHYWVGATSTKSWAGEKVYGILTMLTFSAFSSLSGLPLDYYSTFVIEEKFGFNKSTVALWVKDLLKSYVLALALLPPVVSAILAIIELFGNKFVPYLMLFTLVISLVATVLFPTVLDPWFNKYESLEEGELRSAIEALAASLKFPLGRIYVVDGSTRSSHSNAYFIGFPWYKQIVIYDTLIKEQTTDEIVAVLAHELGHWKRNHMTVLLSMSMFMALMNYVPLTLFLGNSAFFESLGFSLGETPITIALLVYMDTLAPMTSILQFVQNYVTRTCEYDADRFAVSHGKGSDLRRALIALNKSNLSSVDADKLYSTFHHSHPIITERLRAIKQVAKKSD